MTYELAMKLKEAGFTFNKPQILTHVGQELGGSEADGSNYVRFPTLSELIDACGEGFCLLYKSKFGSLGEWVACDQYYGTAFAFFGRGSSPEEAVSLLWISLNKNKDD